MKKSALIEQALKLNTNDKVEVVRQLLLSLSEPAPKDNGKSYEEIIEQRLEEYQHGVTDTSTWDEVKSEYFTRNS